MALVIFIGDLVLRLQMPVTLHVLFDLLQIDEAKHVDSLGHQLLWCYFILALLALFPSL